LAATGIFFLRPHRKGVKKISPAYGGIKNCEALTETIKKIKIIEVNEIDVASNNTFLCIFA
jgi:hypothetical protein